MPPDPWQPTLQLRNVMDEYGKSKILQQLWKNINTGETEWRAVPTVVEERPPDRRWQSGDDVDPFPENERAGE